MLADFRQACRRLATAITPARALVVVAAITLTVGSWPSVASAHTDFVGSTPADGATVTGALGVIEVSFTNPAEPAGDGFVVTNAEGVALTPTNLDPTDGRVFKLNFEPALTDGAYTVNWRVRAGDAHPINGTFTFTVSGAPPTPTTAVPTTVAPDTATAPAATESAAVTTTTVAATTVAAAPTTTSGHGGTGSTAGRIGRLLTFGGTIVSLGILVALAFVVRVSRDELRALITWSQLGGLVVATGGLVELAVLRQTAFATMMELLGDKAGIAVGLKIVGGVLLAVGLSVGPEPKVAGDSGAIPDHDPPGTLVAWVPAPSAIGLLGGALVLVSFWFDGHTVSRGPWLFHAAVNLIHVGAASAWAGGIFTMAVLAWMRRRSAHTGGVAAMIVRFSSVATISLIAVFFAGVAMTLLITDGLGQLTSTEWGRVLLVKIVAVAIAAGIGAYNRFTLVPLVTAQPADDAVNGRLRTTLTIEAAVLGVVIVLSAWLVAAAI